MRRVVCVPLAVAFLVLLAVVDNAAGVSGSARPIEIPERAMEGLGARDREVREADEERARVRALPEAVAERRESRTAFSGLAAAEARQLAVERFPGELRRSLNPAPKLGKDERIERYLGRSGVLIDRGEGEKPAFLQSLVPLVAKDDDGKDAPVALELVERDGRFVSRNPLVDVDISRRADAGASLVEAGVSVRPVAPLAGKAVPEVVADEKVFWAGVDADTDYVIAPVPGGFESFVQVRSEAAPERFTLAFDLPEGARLRDTADGSGVEVVRGEDRDEVVLARMLAPRAWDADHEPVEVNYEVADDGIVLVFPHRGKDLRYPLLIDPVVVDMSDGLLGGAGTGWVRATAGQFSSLSGYADPLYGLSLLGPANGWYVAGASNTWSWQAPGESFIYELGLGPTSHTLSSSDPAQRNRQVTGIFSSKTFNWEPGGQVYDGDTGAHLGSSPYIRSIAFSDSFTVHCLTGASCSPGTSAAPAGTQNNVAVFQQYWFQNGGSTDSFADNLGGAEMWLHEFNPPSVVVQHSVPDPSAWSRATWTDTLALNGSDGAGLGVAFWELDDDADPGEVLDDGGIDCDGAPFGGVPCPASFPTDYYPSYSNAQFPEGVTTVHARVGDILENVGEKSWVVRRDTSPPELSLDDPASGDLYERKGTTLTPGSYKLYLHGTDGSTTSDATRRSGMGSFRVYVGDAGDPSSFEQADFIPVACGTDSCPFDTDWTLQTGAYPPGATTVKVVATDQVGNKTAKTFDVTLPASGTLLRPVNGLRTSKTLSLQARADVAGLTSARFQYRRPLGLWTDVPTAQLTDSKGLPVGAKERPFVGGGAGATTEMLTWDVPATFALGQRDGPLQLRAVLTGGGGGFTKRAAVTVDERGLASDNAKDELGPGSVDLLTGNFSTSTTDVSVAGGAQSLSVSRAFNSRNPMVAGAFGPGWVTTLPVEEANSAYKAVKESTAAGNAYTELITADGSSIYFFPIADEYAPEPGYEDLQLTKPTATRYQLADSDGNVTTFDLQAGASEFTPSAVTQAGGANTTSISWTLSGTKMVPVRAVAPPPAGVGCVPQSVRGCRSISFVYAGGAGSAAPASGVAEAQWGSFAGQVDRIDLTAWDPVTGMMKTDTISRYLYDNAGMLRAVWDPRIGVLKTRYSYDGGGRLSTITPPGEAAWELSYQQLVGDVDAGRLASVKRTTPQGVAHTKVAYGVAIAGPTAPWQMAATDVDKWAQTDLPAEATAVFPVDHVPAGSTPTLAEYEYATVHYMNTSGREVNVVVPGGHTTTTEYDRFANAIRELSATNRQRAMNAGGLSKAEADVLDTERTFTDDGLEMVDELGPRHSVRLNDGSVVSARKHTTVAYDEGAPLTPTPVGQTPIPPAHLPTTTTVGAKVIGGADMVDARVSKTEYEWLLRKPTVEITDAAPGGLQLRRRTFYDPTGLAVETRMPKSIGSDAGTTQTIYYIAGNQSGHDSDCINRPEWAGLVCKTKPAAQPSGNGLPGLPVTTYTYDRLGNVVTETEKVGSTTRVRTNSYDGAGRKTTDAVTVASPKRTGLVAAYGFDEGAGSTVSDLSGNNNTGAVSGASWTAGGKNGGALSFDGVDDSVVIPDSPSLDLSKGMTLEAWVKPTTLPSSKRVILAKLNGSGTAYGLNSRSATTTGFGAEGAATVSSTQSIGVIWHHVAVTYDGQMLRLYYDGTQIATQAATADMLSSSGALRIGGNGVAGQYFHGAIDDVRIYDRALSAQEIRWDKQLPTTSSADLAGFGATLPPEFDKLAAGYDFEEGVTASILDISGNGNNSTLTGSAAPARVAGTVTPTALQFDGTDDQLIMVDKASLDVTKPITIECWVKLDTLPAAGKKATLVSKAGSYYLQVNSSGQLTFGVDPTGAQAFLPANEVTAAGPAVGTWTYVAGSYDGTTLSLYKSNTIAQGWYELKTVATKSLTSAGAAVGPHQLRIGAYGPSTGPQSAFLDGTVDEPRIYARTVPFSELSSHMTTPAYPFSPNDGGVPVPTIQHGYSPTNGRETTLTTNTTYGPIQNSVGYDTLARPTSYTDASGNVSTTTYDLANRIATTNDGKGTQTRTYNDKSGLLTQLVDSQAGTFTATYDPDGNPLTQTYPGGLQATTTFDETAAATDLIYTKSGTWFEEHVKESIHGQWAERDSTLSDQQYDYDKAGRLTQVKDTPTGQGCTTRSYSYDANSNRTNRTTRNPAAGGACDTTSTPTATTDSSYDTADRITNPGFVHDALGRTTTIPATHSGGGPIQMSYYANDLVRSQTQSTNTTQTWLLDVNGQRERGRVVNATGQDIKGTTHYQAASDNPTWTETIQDGTITSWQRNITDINGNLAATATNTSITLQLPNLHGDITATAATTSTSPTATFEADEFGNPRTPAAGYRWLGAKLRPTRLYGGVIQMGVRSYVPAIGRFTSADPIPGGSANSYDYANADPINNVDLDGRCVFDGDLSPIMRRKGKYYFWEVCNKKTGKRSGYLRIKASRYKSKPKKKLARQILRRGAGGAAIVGGVAIQGTCMMATMGLGTVHCLAVAGPLTVGGGILLFGD